MDTLMHFQWKYTGINTPFGGELGNIKQKNRYAFTMWPAIPHLVIYCKAIPPQNENVRFYTNFYTFLY